MAEIVFTIPTDRAELLSEVHSNYTVKNVVIPAEIIDKLEEAHMCLREEGPNFILENFDTYYSILHHADKLRPDVLHKAYNNLQKATADLNNTILFLLDDKDNLTDEIKAKMVNVLKMLVYIYIQFIIYLEDQKKKNQDDLVGRDKNKDNKKSNNFTVDKSKALAAISSIIQREINLFWDPPIVEHDFVGLIAELCFVLLQNPSIKQEKAVIMEIFGVFGNLVKIYEYGKTFVTRLIRTIRMYEHVVHCVAEGITMIVNQFNCQSLIHHFVKEATEWQVDETFQDALGTRCCSLFLTELAVAIPDLILPEVMYLNKYLAHESTALRIAVLNVMYEIVLKVLTKHDLTEEQKELRDEFFEVIIEHVRDVSAPVRVKVIQNLSKLQKENAIPLTFQNEILSEIIKHLKDKAANVRKSAINCVTTFLEHNPYGANLQLKQAELQLAEKKQLLEKMESSYKEAQLAKIEQLENKWKSNIEEDLKEIIQKQLDKGDEEQEETEVPQELDNDQTVEQIRIYLNEKKYLEAFTLCRNLKDSTEEFKNMRKLAEDHEVTVYMTILHSIFINSVKIVEELRTGAGMTAEDIKKIEALENIIKYFENTTVFLKVIENAVKPMKSLLFSQSMSDTNEAIQFFVTAYQFQIDNATEGVLEMLKIMRCSEQERQTAVVEAFKAIYLTTDTRSMAEHTSTIVNRLLSLLKDLSYENLDDFQSIVTEWTSKGILDNSVIDKCWQYYTQRDQVSNDDARAAAEILRMAAIGRYTIITKNINVVSKIIFSEQHKNDMLFLASSCRLLSVAGLEKIDVQSENPPFRIKHTDPIFQNLADILVEGFFQKDSFYSEAMQAGLDFIFRVCSKPMEIAEKMMQQINERLKDLPRAMFLIVRLCELLGCMAVKLLGYLDNSVYRELKRRNYLREERKKESKNKKNGRKSKKARKSILETSVLSESSVNETVLMGAEAEDTDAEFILTVLENDVVSTKGVLGQYSPLILEICQKPNIFTDLLVQQAAVTAMMRYMLVSSKFSRENIRLLFTILEKTAYPEIKCTILVHCSDLLTRFPNIVEPWSDHIYKMLKDALVEVRKTAFFSLANLILRSMIRAHSHIAEMAACLIDQNQEVSEMAKNFFERMAQKENNLVNVIPDIFTHLVRVDEVTEEELRYILKFLFDLVDTSKRLENLVDRFCCKYTPDENMRLNRNITYSLSLINYNDKALRKLREKFPMYQHHLHDAEIYSTFKQILTECSKTKVGKTDLKPIVAEIETCIASVFEVNEDGQPSRPPPVLKSAKKGKGRPKKKSAKKQESDSDEDSDEGKAKGRGRKRGGKKQVTDSEDEDSDEGKAKGRHRKKSAKKQISDSEDNDSDEGTSSKTKKRTHSARRGSKS
ncbi:hypothetical protein Zmor_011225 [Zophobas morio]|uniref:Condensin complex subunit 1 n=1 Tax=Zophobas morio TaxID=2755281 RepID=A0AA38MK92_9CUCU|nr:hypothetical protein Zmor_011225 [Zophobas morio]